MTRSLLPALALLAATGCYAPKLETGSSCVTAPCPEGLVCSPATETCELVAIDAGLDAQIDAAIDALPIDALPIDGPPIDAPIDARIAPVARLLQQSTKKSDVDVETLSVAFSAATTPGNVVVMIGGNPSGALTTVSGGGVSTWTRAVKSTEHSNLEIWYGSVELASSTPVTIAKPGAGGPERLWIGEWSGLAVPVVLDAANASAGASSPAAPPPIITTAMGRDLVVFGIADGIPNTYGSPVPAGWIGLVGITSESVSQNEWYRVETTSVTEAPSVSETSHHWDAALAAFRLAE